MNSLIWNFTRSYAGLRTYLNVYPFFVALINNSNTEFQMLNFNLQFLQKLRLKPHYYTCNFNFSSFIIHHSLTTNDPNQQKFKSKSIMRIIFSFILITSRLLGVS